MSIPSWLPRDQAKPLGYSCPKCEVGTLDHYGTEQTCVGYISPPGHNHDDNCRVHHVYCSEGCCCTFSVRNACPAEGCEWKGRKNCFCSLDRLEINPYPQAADSPFHWVDGGRRLARK